MGGGGPRGGGAGGGGIEASPGEGPDRGGRARRGGRGAISSATAGEPHRPPGRGRGAARRHRVVLAGVRAAGGAGAPWVGLSSWRTEGGETGAVDPFPWVGRGAGTGAGPAQADAPMRHLGREACDGDVGRRRSRGRAAPRRRAVRLDRRRRRAGGASDDRRRGTMGRRRRCGLRRRAASRHRSVGALGAAAWRTGRGGAASRNRLGGVVRSGACAGRGAASLSSAPYASARLDGGRGHRFRRWRHRGTAVGWEAHRRAHEGRGAAPALHLLHTTETAAVRGLAPPLCPSQVEGAVLPHGGSEAPWGSPCPPPLRRPPPWLPERARRPRGGAQPSMP